MPRICVYCASSEGIEPSFYDDARRLGGVLAGMGATVVYGGGGGGSMGALADGALGAGGEVVGILPRFMADLEWGHPGLTHLELVEDMRERKHRMLVDADAVIALPGGCGTFEELFEALTLKRLTLFLKPIILVNTNRYFDPLLKVLEQAVEQRFMANEHGNLWTVVDGPEDVPEAIENAPVWSASMRDAAVVK
ncbi:MAG: TIGR00730 family Rossman fold protein [Pseudomonadota bacterium]